MHTRKGHDRGYSLVEIIVVLAIVGIMSLIAVPQFISYNQNGKMKSAVRQLNGDLRNMRLYAVSQNLMIRTELDTTLGEYRFYSSADQGTTWTAFTPPSGYTSNYKQIDKPIIIETTSFVDVNSNSKPDIVFTPQGTLATTCLPTTGAATIVLRVKWNIAQNRMLITLSSAGQITSVGNHV
jgi:type II secretion system protein H